MALYQISHLDARNDAIFMIVFLFSLKTYRRILEWNFSLDPAHLNLHRHLYTICSTRMAVINVLCYVLTSLRIFYSKNVPVEELQFSCFILVLSTSTT